MGRTFENRKGSMAKTSSMKIKLYTKYGKEIYVAAKNGGFEPDGNPALRRLIDKSKKESVPSHIIDNAIKKAKGGGGEDYVPAIYEGYGPAGVMLIVSCLTDNNNRTIADIRAAFNKCHSKVGSEGSVLHMFEHQAIFSFKHDDEEAVLETLMMADIDVTDIENEDGMLTVFAPHTEYYKIKTTLSEEFADTELEVDEITYEPQVMKEISDADDIKMFEKLQGMLEELDDVQEVYHNADIKE